MDKSAKFWNKRAAKFDSNDNPTSEIRKAKYKQISAYLNREQLVMDYGCATGSLIHEIAHSVKEVHGVDSSDEMIRLANERAKNNNLLNVKFVVGDILEDKFMSTKYDVIIAMYVLHLVPNPARTLKRLIDNLNPQGFLIMEVPCMKRLNFLKKIFFVPFVKLAGLPYLTSFEPKDIDELIQSNQLSIVETDYADDKFPRYFVVAKKD